MAGVWGLLLWFGAFFASWVVSFILFGFIPNTTLISVMTLIYAIWYIQNLERRATTMTVAIIMGLVSIVFFGLVVPILQFIPFAAHFAAYIDRVSVLISPRSWGYAWFYQIPAFINVFLAWTIAVCFVVKCTTWIWKRTPLLDYEKPKKDLFLGFAKLNALLGNVMLVFGILGFFLPFVELFVQFLPFAIFYDVCFVWIPFVTMFFFLDYLWSAIKKEVIGV